jgi:ABC-type uncharacterized transport system substrate-binding protein
VVGSTRVSGDDGTHAGMSATSTIPIVSVAAADPMLLGIVRNIVRPEGKVTGVANLAGDIISKRIVLRKEIIPSTRRIALFMHPEEPISPLQIRDVEQNAAPIEIEPKAFPIRQCPSL